VLVILMRAAALARAITRNASRGQADFGRQMPVMAAPRTLQSDAPAQLFVKGLVDHSHAALGDPAGRPRFGAAVCRTW
jgi:hypothetical protein